MDWQPWLPDNSITLGDELIDLQAIVESWLQDWFFSKETVSIHIGEDESKAVLQDEGGITFDDYYLGSADYMLAVKIAGFDRKRLGILLLRPDKPNIKLCESDIDIVDRLSAECFRELYRSIAIYFKVNDQPKKVALNSAVNSTQIEFKLGKSRLRFCVSIAKPLLVRRIKSKIPTLEKTVELHKLKEALRHQVVKLNLSLGGTKISASDLKGLSTGDIVVLDKLTSDPLEISINEMKKNQYLAVIEWLGTRPQMRLIEAR